MATAGVAELEAVDLAAAAEQYVTQGFVLVKNLITNDEAAAYRTESHRLLTALGGQDDPTWASARSVAGDQATRPPVQPPAIASLNELSEGRGVPSLR